MSEYFLYATYIGIICVFGSLQFQINSSSYRYNSPFSETPKIKDDIDPTGYKHFANQNIFNVQFSYRKIFAECPLPFNSLG